MFDLEPARVKYLVEQPNYKRLTRIVRSRIEEHTKVLGLRCDIDAREKDVASLLKKMLRKANKDNSLGADAAYAGVKDKAGVRATVLFKEQLSGIRKIIEENFEVYETENKADELGYEKLGYLAVHYQIVANEHLLDEADLDLAGLECEIQVHSTAQSLWAAVAHQLSYKPSQSPPDEVQRMIYRLAALLEIFDDEVKRAQDALFSEPGFAEAKILSDLETYFYQFTGKEFDRELSLQLISDLRSLWDNLYPDAFGVEIGRFVQNNRSRIATAINRDTGYANGIILSQPESLLIYYQFERDKFEIEDLWPEILPASFLYPLADSWGVDLEIE